MPLSSKIIGTLFLVLGIFFAGAASGIKAAEPSEEAKQILINHREAEIKWKIRYKDLLKKKKVVLPVPIYVTEPTDCETKLIDCTNALEGIKNWCDPYCREELGECMQALQLTREFNLETYYP